MTDAPAPRRRRSYSQLSTYKQCPRLFHLKYILREPEAPSLWSVAGTAFHQCAEWHLGDQWPANDFGQPFTRQMVWEDAFGAAVAEEQKKNPLAADKPLTSWRAAARGREDLAWWDANGPAMVGRFIDWWRGAGLQPFTDDQGPMLERELDITLGGVPIVAFPDAVVVDEHGQLDILDYKSGKPPKESLQLGVYAAAIREGLGYDPAWGLYYMTRVGQLLPASLQRWPQTLIADLFAEFHERELGGDYTPTPGQACRFCPLKKTCPVAA